MGLLQGPRGYLETAPQDHLHCFALFCQCFFGRVLSHFMLYALMKAFFFSSLSLKHTTWHPSSLPIYRGFPLEL